MRRKMTNVAGWVATLCWLLAAGAGAQGTPAGTGAAAPTTAGAVAPATAPATASAATSAGTAEAAPATTAAPAAGAGAGAAAGTAGAVVPASDAAATATPTAPTAPTARKAPRPAPWKQPAAPAPEPQPPLPPAEDGPFTLGASFTPRWNSDPSYDFFAEDDVTMAYGLWLGYDLFEFAKRFALAAELGWSTEREEQTALAGGALDSWMRTCAWEVSGDLRWEALDVLWPHIRLGGGFAKAKIKLNGSSGDFEDLDFSGTLVGAIGATLKTPAGAFRNARGQFGSLSLGLRVELGYRVMAPTVVNLNPEQDPDSGSLPVTRTSLGEVSRSGPFVGVSLVGRI